MGGGKNMNITPDPKNDMKIEIRNTQCTLIYSSYNMYNDPTYGLSTVNHPFGYYGWLSNWDDLLPYYGILYSNRIFLEKLTFYPWKPNKSTEPSRLKNWYVEIVDKNNNWIEVCKGLSQNYWNMAMNLNTADINKHCYGFRIVCLDSYKEGYGKGLRTLKVYGEIMYNNVLFTNNNNIYGYTE